MRRLAYDLTEGKPGCALIQAMMGGDDTTLFDFPAESWLVYPTKNMRLYELTDEQYAQAVEITRRVLKGHTPQQAARQIKQGE